MITSYTLHYSASQTEDGHHDSLEHSAYALHPHFTTSKKTYVLLNNEVSRRSEQARTIFKRCWCGVCFRTTALPLWQWCVVCSSGL